MHLEKLIKFHGRPGPLLLVVADGVGLAKDGPANALSLANTPVMDGLINSSQSTQLIAHGTHVGLPSDADMGNSEVGHNTLGGGRIFDQGAKLVNSAFESGSIFQSDSWQKIESRGIDGATIHFLGLLSDGNVHAHIDHLLSLITRCQQAAVRSVCIHVLLDGRDVDPPICSRVSPATPGRPGRCQQLGRVFLPNCQRRRSYGRDHGPLWSRLGNGPARIQSPCPR